MTVSSTDRTAGPFIRNGAQLDYPFTMRVFEDADLTVVQTGADGSLTTLVLGADYTVDVNADQTNDPGGTLTMLDVGTSGEQLDVTTDLQATQGVSLSNAGGFFPKVIEKAFDKLTILLQQSGVTKTQVLRAPFPETLDELPPKAERVGKYLFFDESTGAPIAVPGVEQPFNPFTEETVAATADGQRAVTFSGVTFTPGVRSIRVERNGIGMRRGVDYTENADGGGVTFLFDLQEDDEITALAGVGVNQANLSDSALVPYLPAGTGAVATNTRDKLRQRVSVLDKGIIGSYGVIVTSELQALINELGATSSGPVEIAFPRGYFRLAGLITIAYSHVYLVGEGMLATQIVNASATTGALRWASSDPATTILYGGGIEHMTVDVTNGLDHNTGIGVEVVRVDGWRAIDARIANHLVALQIDGCTSGSVSNSQVYTGLNFAAKRKSGSRALVVKNYQAGAKTTSGFSFNDTRITGQIATDGSRDPMVEFALLVDSCDTVFFNGCLFQQADRLIQLRTSRASDKIASVIFTGCFADGNLGGASNTPTADVLFALDGCAATPSLADIVWVGGAMSNARTDAVVLNQSTAAGLTIRPGAVSNIGRWFVNAAAWFGALSIGGTVRNVAQNAPTAADGGGVKIGAAASTSSLSLDAHMTGRDYGSVVNGSPGASGNLGTGLLMSSYAGKYEARQAVLQNFATTSAITVASTGEALSLLPLVLPAAVMTAVSGSPTLGTVGGGRRQAWLLDAAGTEILGAQAYFNATLATRVRVKLVWTNVGAGAGNVVFAIGYLNAADGVTVNVADSGAGNFTVAAPAQDIVKETTLAADFPVAANSTLFVRISRVGGDASDTLANDCGVLALVLTPL